VSWSNDARGARIACDVLWVVFSDACILWIFFINLNSRTDCEGDMVFQKGSDNIDALLPEIIDTDLMACK
jgi:hypothetical protein